MRTSFSHDEDRRLVTLALGFQQRRQRVTWATIACAMPKRSPRELQQRLKSLKRTLGPDLARFPASLRGSSVTADPDPEPEPLALAAVERVLAAMFASVTPRDVLQCAGAPHLNVGELLPRAVDVVIRTVGVTARDVFVDVGSGVGNVVAQVALQTRARKSIGIEIRRELCVRGRQLLRKCELADRLLLRARVSFVCGDAANVCVAARRPMNECTIVYLNNLLFQAMTNAYLSTELCAMPRARFVVATAPFCARHRAPCRTVFCSAWELFEIDHVPASWTGDLVRVYFYQRRRCVSGADNNDNNNGDKSNSNGDARVRQQDESCE